MAHKNIGNHKFYFYDFKTALANNIILTDGQMENTMIYSYYHHDDFPIAMHSHSFYEINIISEGHGQHFIEGNSFSAYTGDVFIIPPDVKHGYLEENNLKIFHILLSNNFMDTYDHILKKVHGYSLMFNIEPKLRAKSNVKLFPSIGKSAFAFYVNEFNKLKNLNDPELESGEINKCIKTLNLICDLSNFLTSDSNYQAKTSFVYTSQLFKVISHIENNFHSAVNITDLCDVSNMSRSTLFKQFQSLFNCSPNDYITNVRIENACKLLSTTHFSIAQIAQDCGFYDSSHFSKAFVAVMKARPKDYRKSQQNKIADMTL